MGVQLDGCFSWCLCVYLRKCTSAGFCRLCAVVFVMCGFIYNTCLSLLLRGEGRNGTVTFEHVSYEVQSVDLICLFFVCAISTFTSFCPISTQSSNGMV